MTMTIENQNENPDQASRAALLLQRYFDGQITDEEGSELLKLWNDFPELTVDALKNYETNHLLQFLSRLESDRQKLFVHTSLPASDSAFFTAMPKPGEDLAIVSSSLDFETLVQLADQSQTIPRRPEETPQINVSKPVSGYRPIPKTAILRNGIMIACLLLLGGFAVYSEFRTPPQMMDKANARPFIASIVSDADVVWSNDHSKPIILGAPLDSQRIRFDSGTLELLFCDGVRCVVEGPADLVLVDKKQFFAKRGRFSVDVPEQGKGFEIQTPSILIRDLGTQFFASVEKDRSELHVIKGIVETEKGDGETNVFETNQAAGFLGNELFERMDAALDLFVTKSEMKRRSDLFYQKMLARLTATSEKESLKGPVCQVDFNQERIKDAMLYGGEIVEGPNPDAKAVRFVKQTDRLRLKSLGLVDAMTALIWVRVDQLDYVMNPIMMSEGNRQDGLVCHILPDGKMLVGIRHRSSQVSGIFETPVVFTEEMLGRWVRIGFAIDGLGKRLAVYVDDNPILFRELTQAIKIDTKNVDVGSWKWENKTNSSGHILDGVVGPISLYDRMLNLAEIKTLP